MKSINFDDYFNDTNNRYYDSKYIITILENLLDNKLDNIKHEVKSTQIIVTKNQIKSFLEKRLEEENPELIKKIECPKTEKTNNIIKNFDETFENYEKNFSDYWSKRRYDFEPYTLKYFEKYTNIIRNKTLVLLNIIEKIGNRDSISIQDFIIDLDIQLDKNGNISKEDIVRLITPTIYNINLLNEKIDQANDLSTYLTFKISEYSLFREGFSENEIYPNQSLQVKNLCYDYLPGNVTLSNNQRNELRKQQQRSMKEIATLMFK